MYGLAIAAAGLFILGLMKGGFFSRLKVIKLGAATDENLLEQKSGRFFYVLKDIITHGKFWKDPFMGATHFFLFWGFIILAVATGLVFLQADFLEPLLGVRFLKGGFYLWFSFIADVGGGLAVIAVIMAMSRRSLFRPKWLDVKAEDNFILRLILAVLLTGFIVEALRMQATELQPGHPMQDYVWASPVGRVTAFFFSSLSASAAESAHRVIWWFHFLVSMGFLIYISRSKLLHMIMTPVNIFLKSGGSAPSLRELPAETFETAETFGIHKAEEYTWKDLFDTEACMRCGKCVSVCPAYGTDKPLLPRDVIQNLRDHLEAKSKFVMKEDGKLAMVADDKYEGPALIGDIIGKDAIWSCTTCMACVESCPAYIHQFPKLIDLRRYLVMMESDFPEEVNEAFKGMENNSNPWSMGEQTRGDWARDLNVPVMAEKGKAEYLYYVGCAGSFDDRNQKVAASVAAIFNKVGLDYAILGSEEGCCGDSARRLGNEYLAQMLIQKNVEVFKKYGVRKIITSCPHGYNILKNEYRQFGGEYEVYHHSEIISRLIKEGKLSPQGRGGNNVVFHDSCYLGRYNKVYDAPRDVIAATGKEAQEMNRCAAESFCCGAGGGRMWMEEKLGSKINVERAKEAVNSGARTIATACPFCMTMMTDGLKDLNKDEEIGVKDIAEIINENLSE
jgi:Fe-S oxidoreductase/nitrate reductase gamma subunit